MAHEALLRELIACDTLDARERNPMMGPMKLIDPELFNRLREALSAQPAEPKDHICAKSWKAACQLNAGPVTAEPKHLTADEFDDYVHQPTVVRTLVAAEPPEPNLDNVSDGRPWYADAPPAAEPKGYFGIENAPMPATEPKEAPGCAYCMGGGVKPGCVCPKCGDRLPTMEPKDEQIGPIEKAHLTIERLTAERDRAVEALAQLVPLAERLRNRINFGPNRKANVVAIIPLIDAALTNSRAALAASLQPQDTEHQPLDSEAKREV